MSSSANRENERKGHDFENMNEKKSHGSSTEVSLRLSPSPASEFSLGLPQLPAPDFSLGPHQMPSSESLPAHSPPQGSEHESYPTVISLEEFWTRISRFQKVLDDTETRLRALNERIQRTTQELEVEAEVSSTHDGQNTHDVFDFTDSELDNLFETFDQITEDAAAAAAAAADQCAEIDRILAMGE